MNKGRFGEISADKFCVRLLAIDDDPAYLQLIAEALEQEGLEILSTTDAEEGLRLVSRKHPQIILLDLHLPKLSGMELLEQIIEQDPSAEVIMMTGDYSTESAVEAIRKGASDYLNKPIPIEKLRQRVDKLIAEVQQQHRSAQLESDVLHTTQFEGMTGRSPLMQEVFAQIRRIAPHFRTALITGATGTGKELVAQALHRQGPVASGPFAVCNCAALVETLLESELFGYVKGSFTGATQDRVGLFEYANGGTVLLDEIGEMPLPMQAKLLRVLQNQEIQRVGSPAPRKVNVRVVAATNRDLLQMVRDKQFRQDLYYRLCMVEIKLPRLIERMEDMPLLQRHFLERFSREYNKPIRDITRRAQAFLSRHAWPGNVRELENVIGHACMMAEGSSIDLRHFPEHLRTHTSPGIAQQEDLVSLEENQRRYVRFVLERVGGNKTHAQEILQMSRATLYRYLSENRTQGQEERVTASACSNSGSLLDPV